MDDESPEVTAIDRYLAQLFALVSEALAQATHALLAGEPDTGQAVIDRDATVDALTAQVEELVWAEIESGQDGGESLRHLVGILLILPELERSADLAEHVAQRAVVHLGSEMSPLSRGIVQRMTEVALEMWGAAANAYANRSTEGLDLAEDDEEIDILHERLTREIAAEKMPTAIAAQVTLLARFYERLGDHAVNLGRRIGSLPERRT